MKNTISVHMQVHSKKRATLESLRSFRRIYKKSPITVVSDGGEDFTSICDFVGAKFVYSDFTTTTRSMTMEGVYVYLERIYNHCVSVDTEWVINFEDDVRLLRPIRYFPFTSCGGPRSYHYHDAVNRKIIKEVGMGDYRFGMCGGSIFKREAFIDSYNRNRNLTPYAEANYQVSRWSDIPLTLIFQINGYKYSQWNEVSELFDPDVPKPIIRDSALDHAYKYWYDKPFKEYMLDEEYLDNYIEEMPDYGGDASGSLFLSS